MWFKNKPERELIWYETTKSFGQIPKGWKISVPKDLEVWKSNELQTGLLLGVLLEAKLVKKTIK